MLAMPSAAPGDLLFDVVAFGESRQLDDTRVGPWLEQLQDVGDGGGVGSAGRIFVAQDGDIARPVATSRSVSAPWHNARWPWRKAGRARRRGRQDVEFLDVDIGFFCQERPRGRAVIFIPSLFRSARGGIEMGSNGYPRAKTQA